MRKLFLSAVLVIVCTAAFSQSFAVVTVPENGVGTRYTIAETAADSAQAILIYDAPVDSIASPPKFTKTYEEQTVGTEKCTVGYTTPDRKRHSVYIDRTSGVVFYIIKKENGYQRIATDGTLEN